MHHVVVAIPMDRLRTSLRRPELAAGAVISRGRGASALLSDYLVSIAGEYDELDVSAASSAAAHLATLVALVLNECHGEVPLPRDAVRAAIYSRASQIIEQELGDSSLSPGRIAKRLHVSVRFLHGLFTERGTSTMRHVYDRRVRRAAAMLDSTEYSHRSITDIAMSCGFSDLTHFGRVFSRTFHASPRTFRAQCL